MKLRPDATLEVKVNLITIPRGDRLRTPARNSTVYVSLHDGSPGDRVAITEPDENDSPGSVEVSGKTRYEACTKGTAYTLSGGMSLGTPLKGGNFPAEITMIMAVLEYK